DLRELQIRSWDLQLSHVYHEANYIADYSSNLGHSLYLGCHLFYEPDALVIGWLKYDLISTTFNF
ncbi:hypothetical protein LINPERPRIM_LOCUS33936, partial [Linum perenne]